MSDEERAVLDYFPEIGQIADGNRRAQVLAVWTRMLEESGFDALTDVPIAPHLAYSQFRHNRAILEMALAVAEVLERYHGVAIDRDDLLSVALLQDVSKLVEFEPDGAGARLSPIGQQLRHPVYGVHAALAAGCPVHVAQGILEHSPKNPRVPPQLVTSILYFLDRLDMMAVRESVGGGDHPERQPAD
ncbi:MAG TPA: hypothetical protein VGP36_18760 [Mycobacteriales bacterium]|jgi:hypothetical protein|nr:hypothetical protein [Mycobacteriales bacterium]